MKMSPFSAPFFWGTQKRGLLLPKRAAALWEGTQWCKGGTGKAEAAKLPDAGISLKQCPGKWGRKRGPTETVRVDTRSKTLTAAIAAHVKALASSVAPKSAMRVSLVAKATRVAVMVGLRLAMIEAHSVFKTHRIPPEKNSIPGESKQT